ncbi:hypothetical protein GIR22_16410 [Pseudomonas sp. CCM 7891]|uniref:Uncharacterized protein n=1 Tax=Pseudomonas karstica TaxID=1055468 RepID=A0A7X2UYE1_9PSED|nr:hypothetical protein [Pseudomonas karstica]MTD20711.1 hypothetical protein [Pseudomonas karstica]
MSAIHEQAMNHVYQQVLQRLIGHFSRAERTALQLLIQRLIVAAGGIEQIGGYKVLVTHGGGKGSSYTLAFLRAAQLTIAGRSPRTFHLRVATLRHAGMTQKALDTIHRGYSALFFHEDPRVELLMVENQDVLPFNHLRPASSAGREASRRHMLMIGHLTSGDIRATLCNDSYLALGDFYQRVTVWGGGVHAWVSGDSSRKQRQYLAWLKKSAQAAGLSVPERWPVALNSLFAHMAEWSAGYYRDVYGEHYVSPDSPSPQGYRHLAYIDIADLISDLDKAATPLLTQFLGYQPDEFGFHFSNPAYANPLFMAHLRGLQAQCLRELDYASGVNGFMQQAHVFMGHKSIPGELIAQAGSQDGRILSTTYTQEFFGLDENQLTCLLFSPFIHHGERLESYLRHCHPGMLVALPELHKALQGKPVADMLQNWITDTSGLPMTLLLDLYRKRPGTGTQTLNQTPARARHKAPTCQLSER